MLVFLFFIVFFFICVLIFGLHLVGAAMIPQRRYLMAPIDPNLVINEPIDVVFTWANSSDPAWQKARDMAIGGASYNRFRHPVSPIENGEELELSKSVQLAIKNLKFARNFIIVTPRPQRPKFIDTLEDPSKIRVVHLEDIATCVTFNSNVIEMFLYKIPGLSHHFIYFNDDMYVIKPLTAASFFTKDMRCMVYYEKGARDLLTRMALSSNIAKRMCGNFFTSHQDTLTKWKACTGDDEPYMRLHQHGPRALSKEIYRDVVERTEFIREIENNMTNLVRSKNDIAILDLIAHAAIKSGKAVECQNPPIMTHSHFFIPISSTMEKTTFYCLNFLNLKNPKRVRKFNSLMSPYLSKTSNNRRN